MPQVLCRRYGIRKIIFQMDVKRLGAAMQGVKSQYSRYSVCSVCRSSALMIVARVLEGLALDLWHFQVPLLFLDHCKLRSTHLHPHAYCNHTGKPSQTMCVCVWGVHRRALRKRSGWTPRPLSSSARSPNNTHSWKRADPPSPTQLGE